MIGSNGALCEHHDNHLYGCEKLSEQKIDFRKTGCENGRWM